MDASLCALGFMHPKKGLGFEVRRWPMRAAVLYITCAPVVLDPERRVYRQFDGNKWKAEELPQALTATPRSHCCELTFARCWLTGISDMESQRRCGVRVQGVGQHRGDLRQCPINAVCSPRSRNSWTEA